MATAGEIRQHIRAVQQTRKITNAMHMIASTRMKRVTEHVEYSRQYLKKVRSTMWDLLRSSSEASMHPYFARVSPGKKRTYIVLAADKGLAGPYNHNVLGYAWEELQRHPGSSLISVGQMASTFFHSHGKVPDIELLSITQDPSLYNAQHITFEMIDLFNKGLTGSVYIIFTQFGPGVRGVPICQRLLPLQENDYWDLAQDGAQVPRDILFIPSAQELFNLLVPQYLVGLVFCALVQAYASEHFARMNAMHSATQSADDLIAQLQLRYNLARQAAITQELTEISGSTEAMMGDETIGKA